LCFLCGLCVLCGKTFFFVYFVVKIMPIPFRYHPDILTRFPKLAGGAMLVGGLTNGPSPEALRQLYTAEQQAVIVRTGATPLSEIETLAGWRAAFRLFGVDPTQYRSAAEALLRRLTKKGDIPSINRVVDLCNLVSIRYGLPVAAIDRRAVQGPITVQFASGQERFTVLGDAGVELPAPGEVIFVDEAGLVVARRWCWRQSEESAAQDDTTDLLITIEAQHTGGREAVGRAFADLETLLRQYVGGVYQPAFLYPAENPS
jgi:DNA/RNA-binding domain of Phe-tRNA-synthetase-like protein